MSKPRATNTKQKIVVGTIVAVGLLLVAVIMGIFWNAFNHEPGQVTPDANKGEEMRYALTNPLKSCRMVDVPYEDLESYTTSEPYQATEEYTVDLKYENTAKSSTSNTNFDVKAVGEVSIRNVDSETGRFAVSQTFTTLKRPSQTLTTSYYIMPGETKTFEEEYDIDFGEDFKMTYIVTPGQKTLIRQVTAYRDVTAYRTVTKYREEEQCS